MWDWLNCHLLGRHEHGIWCEDGTIFLRCLYCGKRSAGWEVAHGAGPAHPPARPARPPLPRAKVLEIPTRLQVVARH